MYEIQGKKPAARDVSRYEDGQKYCSYCEIFMKVEELRCPCCNKQMKTRSNNKALREVMFNRI
ncbi:MAG: hypothetical protein ACR2LL_02000 [Nitrosopumilus sp.]